MVSMIARLTGRTNTVLTRPIVKALTRLFGCEPLTDLMLMQTDRAVCASGRSPVPCGPRRASESRGPAESAESACIDTPTTGIDQRRPTAQQEQAGRATLPQEEAGVHRKPAGGNQQTGKSRADAIESIRGPSSDSGNMVRGCLLAETDWH